MKTQTLDLRTLPRYSDKERQRIKLIRKNEAAMQAAAAAAVPDASEPADNNRGPFPSSKAALDFLVGRLSAGLDPLAIILMGSRARQDWHPDSDYDLMVITERKVGAYEAYQPIVGCSIEVDVIPWFVEDFRKDRDEPGTMAYQAEREGRFVFARRDGPFHDRFRADSVALERDL